MKTDLRYLFKVSAILTIAIFLIERSISATGFNLPAIELFQILGVHFMHAFSLLFLNAYFFEILNKKYTWKDNAKQRLIIGAIGSVAVTMAGIVVLRFVSIVIFSRKSIEYFANDPNAINYYVFSFVITLIVSLLFHAIYFYKALTESRVEEQQIVAKTETAKYESLKSQIDPHFLFNSLNVLTALISENPEQAEKFTTKLSKVYRYVLEQKNKDLIALDEELAFARTYMELLKMRFENGVIFEIPEKSSNSELKIIPLSLQLLLENSIKHNAASEDHPLIVTITESAGYLTVSNNYNPKTILEKGTKVGLKNIIERYQLLTLKKVEIEQNKTTFTVKLPLLTQKIKVMHTSTINENNSYLKAVERVEALKGFYGSLAAYLLVIPFLIYINLTYSPIFHWFWFSAIGWGIGLIFQGFKAYDYNPFLGSNWEERKIKEYMNEDQQQFWD